VQTWLSRIAINVVRNHARRQVRRGPNVASDEYIIIEPVDLHGSPERNFLKHERIDAVWNASRGISPQQEKVFRLRFVNDLTTREIAEAMAISEGAVKGHLARALDNIRTRLLFRETTLADIRN